MMRPNILLVLIDCARSDKWLGPDRTTRTPHLDALAGRGAVFPTMIAEKSFTAPAVASLLTGQYSPKHGVHMAWGYRLQKDVEPLTRPLRQQGYSTYAEVTGPLLPEMGFGDIFDRFEYRVPDEDLASAWGDRLCDRLRNGHYRRPWFLLLHLFELHRPRKIDASDKAGPDGSNDYERAVSSLDRQLGRLFAAVDRETMVVVTGDHGEKTRQEVFQPGTAVPYIQDRLRLDEAKGMPLFRLAYWTGPAVLQQFYEKLTPLVRDLSLPEMRSGLSFGRWVRMRDMLRLLGLLPRFRPADLLKLKARSGGTALLKSLGLLDPDRSLRKVDRLARKLGRDRLLEMQLRLWLNSYRANLEEGHGMHVYDYLIRVPLVIFAPGRVPAGMVIPRMIRQPDLLPTLLDLIGLSDDRFDRRDGRSFKALLEGRPWQPSPAFISVTGAPRDLEIIGVRTEEYKYTYAPANSKLPEELYDLGADPKEMVNLAGQDAARCRAYRRLADSFMGGEKSTPPALSSPDDEAAVKAIERNLRALGYLD
jgi:arylsulfatase A-like enzyme